MVCCERIPCLFGAWRGDLPVRGCNFAWVLVRARRGSAVRARRDDSRILGNGEGDDRRLLPKQGVRRRVGGADALPRANAPPFERVAGGPILVGSKRGYNRPV